MTQRLTSISAIGSLALVAIVAGTFVGYGCGDDEPTTTNHPDAGTTSTPDAAANGGNFTHFVASTLKAGPTPDSNALDIGGSSDPDNTVGTLLIGLSLAGFDVDATLATAVGAGDIILLHSINAPSLTSASTATWQIYIGDPTANPKFDGTGTFTIASDSPTNAILSGSIAAGKFSGGPGTVSLQVALISGADPLDLTLYGTKLEADVTATGCTNGKLDGAIKKGDLHDHVLPALVDGLNAKIAADGTCSANFETCNTSNKALLMFIDRDSHSGNSDNHIQLSEIEENGTVAALLVADLDFFNDTTGAPGADGTNDSLSLAVGFECSKAVFTASSEH
jgi:hypothetical protein